MKNLVFIPFAFDIQKSTGVNIKGKERAKEIYLKNICVALISATKNAGNNCDIALVTNDIIPNKFIALLEQNGVKIIYAEFNTFNFSYEIKWSLAFYKLCALNYVVNNLNYEKICYLDSDVFVQGKLDPIWDECIKDTILLYDINHGIQVDNYRTLLTEITDFTSQDATGTVHYGGEFFAANIQSAKSFNSVCLKIFQDMDKQQFTTTKGDEFIISIAAKISSLKVRNSGAYISRYWTRSFNLTSTNYKFNPVLILHVPSEKEDGMLTLYNRYICRHKFPKKEHVWRILHLNQPRASVRLVAFIKKTSLLLKNILS